MSVLQAVLDAIDGTLDTSTEIADHPNVKYAQMQRLGLLHAQDAQITRLTAERDRWQAKAFDYFHGMMEAMTARDEARRAVTDDRYEHMVFNTLARDLWAELIAARAEIARLTRTP